MTDRVLIAPQILTMRDYNFEIETLYQACIELQESVSFSSKNNKKYQGNVHLGPELVFFVQGNDVFDVYNDFIYRVFDIVNRLKTCPWDECFGSIEQYNAFKKYVRLA